MHGSEGARPAGLPLHDDAEQEEPAHAEPAREKEIQSVFEAAHAPSRDEITSHATENRQTPFRFPPRQSHDATPPHRYRDRSDRLQEPRSAEEIRHRERKDPAA